MKPANHDLVALLEWLPFHGCLTGDCLHDLQGQCDTALAQELRKVLDLAKAPVPVPQRPNGCWAACISTLTGIPLDEFPLVPDDARDEAWWDEHGTRLRNDITAVLRKHGWRKESTWTDVPRGFAMAYGMSPRGYQHAVVVKDGELWHDPHPEGGGILDVEQYEILVPLVRRASNQEKGV